MSDSKHIELTERAKGIIQESHLPKEDKITLLGRIPFVAESILMMFVQVCEEDPFGIEAIVRSLKKKLDAQGNLKRLHEVIKQERDEIENVLVASF